MTANNNLKVVVEVLAEESVEDLSSVIPDGIRDALNLDDDADISEHVDVVVTGVSPDPALDIIQYAVGEAGIDTNYNSDSFQMFEPKEAIAASRLDDDDFASEQAKENRAKRNAAEFRNKLLCEGTDDHAAADQFVLVTDDVSHDDVYGLTAGAKGFISNIRDNGRLNDLHVAYEGVPADADSDDDASESADADNDADADASNDNADDGDVPEPSDAEVEDEFEELVA